MRPEWKTTACPHDCPCACTMKARNLNNKIEMKPHDKNRWTEFICPRDSVMQTVCLIQEG